MIVKIFFLFISGLFKEIPVFNLWHEKQKKKLKEQNKKSIAFQRLNIKKGLCIEISELTYTDEKSGWSIWLEKVRIKIRWKKIFSPVQMISSLAIYNGEVKRMLQSRGNGSANTATDYDKKLKQLYIIAGRLGKLFLRILPHHLQIENVALMLNERSGSRLDVLSIHLKESKIAIHVNLHSSSFQHIFQSEGRFKWTTNSAHILWTSSFAKNRVSQDDGNAKAKGLNVENILTDFSIHYGEANYRGTIVLNVLMPSVPFESSSAYKGGALISVNLNFVLDASGLTISEDSKVELNKIVLPVFYEHNFQEKRAKLGLQLKLCSIGDLLDWFPSFQYTPLCTATFSGTFGFSSVLSVHLVSPYEHHVQSTSISNLSLQEQGQMDLAYLKFPFVHAVYENGKFLKEIILDAENPFFVPLDKISPHLIHTVILTEDRNFYKHKGVDMDGLGFAVLYNIAAKKVVRGGSTITAQLVKNLFLSQQRRISRKFEEMILIWLMEEVFRIGKDRMLEIYLNIIEFAPNVYGIEEASKLYFSKPAHELSLSESLVLTYIIPRPKFFLKAVQDKSPVLLGNLTRHMEFLSLEMLKREMVTENDFRNMNWNIVFANGLGDVVISNKMECLCPDLCDLYIKALILWMQRYKDQPIPFLSCTYLSEQQQELLYSKGREDNDPIVTYARPGESPHNHNPSWAFDIAFKTPLGSLDWSEKSFIQFAELMDEVDRNHSIVWGGKYKDFPHFELSGWQKKVGRTVVSLWAKEVSEDGGNV